MLSSSIPYRNIDEEIASAFRSSVKPVDRGVLEQLRKTRSVRGWSGHPVTFTYVWHAANLSLICLGRMLDLIFGERFLSVFIE